MKKKFSTFFVLLVCMISGFHPTTSLAQIAESKAQSAIEEESARIYNNLSLFSESDRRSFYKELKPEIKSNLWKIQLRSYLSEHSELTDKQRQVIEDGIAFVTPEIYKIPQDSPEWEKKVNKLAQLLKGRMLEVFARKDAKELMTVLRGPVSLVSINTKRINFISGMDDAGCSDTGQATNPELIKETIKTQPQSFKMINISLESPEFCDCSTSSDWCDEQTSCTSVACRQAQFCGTLGLYVCNGLCIYYP